MRKVLRMTWSVLAIAGPMAAGAAWCWAGHPILGGVGVVVGLVNTGLLVRRSIPLRIPSFVPPEQRPPIVLERLRWPLRG